MLRTDSLAKCGSETWNLGFPTDLEFNAGLETALNFKTRWNSLNCLQKLVEEF